MPGVLEDIRGQCAGNQSVEGRGVGATVRKVTGKEVPDSERLVRALISQLIP